MALKEIWSNSGISKLAAPIGAADVSLTLKPGDGQLFPAPAEGQFFRLCLSGGGFYEIVFVHARAGDGLTSLERGQEGTVARDWPVDSGAVNSITAGAVAALARKKGGSGYSQWGF